MNGWRRTTTGEMSAHRRVIQFTALAPFAAEIEEKLSTFSTNMAEREQTVDRDNTRPSNSNRDNLQEVFDSRFQFGSNRLGATRGLG